MLLGCTTKKKVIKGHNYFKIVVIISKKKAVLSEKYNKASNNEVIYSVRSLILSFYYKIICVYDLRKIYV